MESGQLQRSAACNTCFCPWFICIYVAFFLIPSFCFLQCVLTSHLSALISVAFPPDSFPACPCACFHLSLSLTSHWTCSQQHVLQPLNPSVHWQKKIYFRGSHLYLSLPSVIRLLGQWTSWIKMFLEITCWEKINTKIWYQPEDGTWLKIRDF